MSNEISHVKNDQTESSIPTILITGASKGVDLLAPLDLQKLSQKE